MAAGKRAKTPKKLPRQDANTPAESCRGKSLGKAQDSERSKVQELERAAVFSVVGRWSSVGRRFPVTDKDLRARADGHS